MDDHIFPNDTPFAFIDCKEAFNLLSKKEKFYAHYLSKASFVGSLIVFCQTSLESPLICILLHKLFKHQTTEELSQIALQSGLSEEDYTAFLVYTSAFFENMSNYRSAGDCKFIPNLPKEKFEKLIRASKLAEKDPKCVEAMLSRCLDTIYSLNDNEKHLGFPEIGKTSYLSKDFSKDDQEIVNKFLKEQNIEAYNTRLFKSIDESGSHCYDIKFSSVLKTDDPDSDPEMKKLLETVKVLNENTLTQKFRTSRGDFSQLLDLVNQELFLAKTFASNENETKMIENYIKSFHTGSLNAHKDGSRFWIKNKDPVVETYIGFIETYRDPAGLRAEFEGFVAMVNKAQSEKFNELVRQADTFLPLLPWPKEYEKDVFLQPDFTSLDVLTFAGSSCPIGINIPNYDEIKQSEGFKNVSLGNVIRIPSTRPPNYLCKADQEILQKYRVPSLELVVGLHELLGHGSGKLFQHENGTFNFDVETVLHLETNEKITSWYEEGQNYDVVFGNLSSPCEECRAECVGIYLATVPDILKIFGHEGSEAENVLYGAWLISVYSGLESIRYYNPKNKVWLQAHCQAAFVILQACIEAGKGFIKIERITGEDGKPDLLFTMDRNKIRSVGMPAVGNLLNRLQLYKATADANSMKKMFDKYSEVTSEGDYPFLDFREIVLARKKPVKLMIQTNTFIEDGEVKLKDYEASAAGLIKSWTDRYDNENIYRILEDMWDSDKNHFK